MNWKNCTAAGMFVLAGMLTVSALQTASAAEKIPNPIVEYATVQQAAEAAGLTPLYLPKIAGYHVTNVSVISRDTVDIDYMRDGNTETKICVRTTKHCINHLSGVNGATWTKKPIHNTVVATAAIPSLGTTQKGYAAEWKQDDYCFSVMAESISAAEFENLLTDGFVDLSEHYFD